MGSSSSYFALIWRKAAVKLFEEWARNLKVHLPCYFYSRRQVFTTPKSIQATVTLLENLHIILDKQASAELKAQVLPMLHNAFDSSTIQVQVNKYIYIQG